MKPGEYFLEDHAIPANAGRSKAKVTVKQTGDRPVQVGSHYHFAETNAALDFDRSAAHGKRLDIAAGTAVRFEPGDNAPGGRVRLAFAGGGDVELTVECVDAALADVSAPWPTSSMPAHEE